MSKGKKTGRRTSLREEILGKREEDDSKTSTREVHVMTRLSAGTVEAIDALVTLNVFKSRSEAVAAYVEKAILNNEELYERLKKKAREVADMTESAMEDILETL